MYPEEMELPELMKAARKRLSLSPPLVSICREVDIAPALPPQLSHPLANPASIEASHVHGDSRGISAKRGDVLLDPAQTQTLWKPVSAAWDARCTVARTVTEPKVTYACFPGFLTTWESES